MASFPTSVKSFSARTSGETIAASHINDLQDEVAAIEADLINGLTNTLKPISNDGAALGTSALSWSDLFLASGGVLNFNNGDVTITHSANALAFAGASSGYTFDSTLAWGGGSAISSSSNVATLSGTQTFTGRKTISFAGGGDYVAEFMNTTAATPYTVWIKEPAAAVSGYPLLAITNNSASSTWFRVDSGTGATTLGGNVFLAATKVLYLDGGSNTYIYEPSGDKIHLVTNGVVGLNVQENYIAIPATNKLYLDGSNGAGSNTYIYEEAADTISFYAGGTRRFQVASSGVTVESAASAFTVHPTATFTGNIRMTSGYTISWSSDDYRIFRNGDTLRFDQAGVQALLFSGSQAATFAGTLAWGGGSAISSSSNVALLNGANTFTNNNTFSEDVRIYRSGGTTTGYINFGSTGTNYFGYSGTGFVVNGSLNVGTLLTVSGLGTHSFSAGGTWDNEIFIRNTTAGTTARAGIRVGNDNNTGAGQFLALSSTYTTTGPELQDSVILRSLTAGGLSLAAQHASGDLRLYSRGGALALTLGASQLATFTGSIRMTNGYTISWSSDDYRIFRNGDTLRFDQAGVQALLFSGSQAATCAGTLAWGGGSAISSSSNVALLNASNTFTGATQTIDSASTDATLALDSSATGAAQVAYYRNGSYKWSVGAGAANDSPNFQWYNRTGSALRMQLTEEGLLTVSGFGVHSFSAGGTGDIGLRVRNTTAGTGNYANVSIGNDLNPTAGYLLVTSSTWTTSGAFVQNSAIVNSEQAGGLSLSATNASGDVRLYSRNALALTLGASQVASFTGNVRLIASTSDWLEVSNSSNTEKAVYVASNANGTAATAAFRVQNVNYTGWLTLPTATFTTAGLREANVLALVGDAPTLRLGTSHGSGVVQFYSGNTLALTLGASQAASFTGDLSLAATKKLYLDGGGDTYIQEDTGNRLTVVTGGVEGINITSAGIWKTTWSTTAAAANAYVADGSYLLRSTSSIRYKHDIDTLDADHALSAVMAMHPVTYRSKTDDDQRRHVGFIAEEMQTIAPLLATYDEGGETGTPNYVTYDRVTAYLVAVVQKQQAEIDALKAQIKG